MYYRYMYFNNIWRMFIERYYNNECYELYGETFIFTDYNLIVNSDLFDTFLNDNGMEKKIVKLHSLPKNLFSCMILNKPYGIQDCVYGNISINHFVCVMPYSDGFNMPYFDYNYNPIFYFKDEDVVPYCDDANIIYSYDKIVILPFDQRLSLFYKYY